MTCIVGFTHKNKVYIGGDSAGVGGLAIRIRKDPKVFINGEFIMGYTSSFRMGQILRFSFKPPEHKEYEKKSDYEFLCTDFIKAIRKCLKDEGYARIKDNEDLGGHFLIGYKGKLYGVGGDFQVSEVATNYDACGCGEAYALGALKILSVTKQSPKTQVHKALEAAEYFSAGVSGPYTILSL